MRFVSWIAFCLCVSCVNSKQKPLIDFSDGATIQDKKKIDALALELLYNMQLMQRQLLPLKIACTNKMAYQIGLVMGTMREKYKRMMELYIENERKKTGRIKIYGPGVKVFRPYLHMIDMEKIRMLEVEIHKYVDLLVKIPEEELNELDNLRDEMANAALNPPQSQLRNGTNAKSADSVSSPEVLRTPSPSTTTRPSKVNMVNKKQPILTEEDIKRQYREQYQKKNGINDDSWSLDRLYGFV